MATSDSHNSPYPGQRRVEAPLPPLPSSASSHTNHHHHSFSPVMSPSDDPSYQPGGRRSDQSLGSNREYYRAGGENPFQDPIHYSDDIPLQQNPSNGNAASFSPYNSQHDPNGGNSLQGREHRPGRTPKKKGGFFSKRTPWAVYLFTAVQIAVFIAELVKNGKQRPKISSKRV